MKYIYSDLDPIFDEAVRLVIGYDKASTSLLQRKFRIGYNRAARIIDQMGEMGILSPADGEHPRDVKIKTYEEYAAIKKDVKKPFFLPIIKTISYVFEFKGFINMGLLIFLLIIIIILSNEQNQLRKTISSQNEQIFHIDNEVTSISQASIPKVPNTQDLEEYGAEVLQIGGIGSRFTQATAYLLKEHGYLSPGKDYVVTIFNSASNLLDVNCIQGYKITSCKINGNEHDFDNIFGCRMFIDDDTKFQNKAMIACKRIN